MKLAYRQIWLDRDIYITDNEIKSIHTINNIKLEKVLFAFLYLDKKYNGYIKLNIAEIRRLTGIKSNNDTIRGYIRQLCKLGHLTSSIDNKHRFALVYSVKADLKQDGNEILVKPKNLYMYYLEGIGQGKYIRCAECGCIEEKKSNRKKYCEECAIRKHNKHQ